MLVATPPPQLVPTTATEDRIETIPTAVDESTHLVEGEVVVKVVKDPTVLETADSHHTIRRLAIVPVIREGVEITDMIESDVEISRTTMIVMDGEE